MKKAAIVVVLFVVLLIVVARSHADQQGAITPIAYLPFIMNNQITFTKSVASPLYLQNYANGDGCNWLGAAGEVLDSNHSPVTANSYRVHVWGSGIDERSIVGDAPAYSPSGWEQTLFNAPVINDYQLQLETMDGTAVSPIYAFQTRAACNENLVRFDFLQNEDS